MRKKSVLEGFHVGMKGHLLIEGCFMVVVKDKVMSSQHH